ncbi:uncharacterized protein LOC133526873 [Cydia pomonella]|uniref:uncharacterized protein LOC133526873 n=1 Tax=Cydia pomonella TaxID=82600 RepID=UPI002ADE2DB0|nr:uncharacterized protein LOC133526873 [Cydia pomonella]
MQIVTVLLVLGRFLCVENTMFSRNYKRDVMTFDEDSTLRYPFFNFASESKSDEDEDDNGKEMALESSEKEILDSSENNTKLLGKLKEPCAIVVRSNIHPTMQSLLRKYRYDAKGALIPSSVRYFIKVPQGLGEPLLVPLNDKSVSHLGGFVRYYKEVPPIPQALYSKRKLHTYFKQ